MLDDEEPQGIVLPMLRFEKHPEQGFIREPSTCRRFYVERGKYCAALIADAWLDDSVKVIDVKLGDLDEFDLPFHAIVPNRAAKQFKDTCNVLNNNMKVAYNRVSKLAHKNQLQEIEWGYDIPPVGVCDVLGYFSSTGAWLVCHPTGPALLTRPDDAAAEDCINKFLLYWAEAKDVPNHWWQKHEGVELEVNVAVLPTLSTRARKPMARGVRRFLGL